MLSAEFFKIISSIEIGKHIVGEGRGSEENVKIKIIVPLLQFLGYDIVRDIDFEVGGADIVLNDRWHKPFLVIETKTWGTSEKVASGQHFKRHLKQGLSYSINLEAPYVIISSGQQTSTYSIRNLINNKGNFVSNPKPFLQLNFDELKRKNKQLSKFYSYFNKIKLSKNNRKLHELRQYIRKLSISISTPKKNKIIDDKFKRLLRKHPASVYKSFLLLHDELNRIAKENSGDFKIYYGTKEVGLQYKDPVALQSTYKLLFSLNPASARIMIGIKKWPTLVSWKYFKEMDSFNRVIKKESEARKVIKLLNLSVNKLTKSVKKKL